MKDKTKEGYLLSNATEKHLLCTLRSLLKYRPIAIYNFLNDLMVALLLKKRNKSGTGIKVCLGEGFINLRCLLVTYNHYYHYLVYQLPYKKGLTYAARK